jgi:hypothetical protein
VLVGTATAWAAPEALPRRPTAEERALMDAVLPRGQRVCSPRFAVISGADRRYGAIVTKTRCGQFASDHYWLRRATPSRDARWRILDRRRSRLGSPPGCTSARGVPIDIRCW